MRIRVKVTKKQSRQDMILRLVRENQISTQQDLEKELVKFGFEVTQSSLSRDIAELGLVKQHGHYVIPPRQMHGPTPLITSIETAGPYMLVIKTLVGAAASVGISIDGQKIPGVVGSVSGDDTVFVAASSGSSHDAIKKAVRKIFKGE